VGLLESEERGEKGGKKGYECRRKRGACSEKMPAADRSQEARDALITASPLLIQKEDESDGRRRIYTHTKKRRSLHLFLSLTFFSSFPPKRA
jgi:hypothetical protein